MRILAPFHLRHPFMGVIRIVEPSLNISALHVTVQQMRQPNFGPPILAETGPQYFFSISAETHPVTDEELVECMDGLIDLVFSAIEGGPGDRSRKFNIGVHLHGDKVPDAVLTISRDI